MAPSSTISSKGQITVPLSIRERLGLRKGDRVEFVVQEGLTILRPARSAVNGFEKYVGVLPAFASGEEIDAWVSEMRDEEVDPR